MLRPGGKVVAQGLVSAEPFPGTPDLPGLASKIRSVPLEHAADGGVAQAGFTDLFFEQNGNIKCFKVAGVEFRKIRVIGRKPDAAPAGAFHAVMYKGPFRDVTGDDGTVYRRGEEVAVTARAMEQLRQGPAGTQFTVLR